MELSIRSRRRLLMLIILMISFSHYSYTQMHTYKGQALFIWNFTKHIKWQSNSTSFNIGVLGKCDLYQELSNNLKGKIVDSRVVEVKTLNALDEAFDFHIIYIPSARSKDLQALIPIAASKGILLITEDDLIAKGAGISFLSVEDKLRFKINQEALAKNGLQVSGGLISLAIRI